jgi:hypothetical protein
MIRQVSSQLADFLRLASNLGRGAKSLLQLVTALQPAFSPFFFAFGRRLPLATRVTALPPTPSMSRPMNKELLVEIRPWYGDHSNIGVLR